MARMIREVRVKDLIFYLTLPSIGISAVAAALWAVLRCLPGIHPAISIAIAVVLWYFLLKYFVIGVVLLYKAFAPMRIRECCRFEPSCSTYMIIAIKKYGFAIGLFKGIRRIFRCRPPNGGVDYP